MDEICNGTSTTLSGAVNRCKSKPRKEIDGRIYCTRHYNLVMRDIRIEQWLRDNELCCADHPDRKPQIFTHGKQVYCSAKVGNQKVNAYIGRRRKWSTSLNDDIVQVNSPVFCSWRVDVPVTIWNGV